METWSIPVPGSGEGWGKPCRELATLQDKTCVNKASNTASKRWRGSLHSHCHLLLVSYSLPGTPARLLVSKKMLAWMKGIQTRESDMWQSPTKESTRDVSIQSPGVWGDPLGLVRSSATPKTPAPRLRDREGCYPRDHPRGQRWGERAGSSTPQQAVPRRHVAGRSTSSSSLAAGRHSSKWLFAQGSDSPAGA